MKSPFAIFRKHQKMLTVVLTGLAMFAFVILGAVPDPGNMPPALMVIVFACIFGGIGWALGIRKKKSSEFGLVGVIAGTVLGVVASMAGGPSVMVKADTGNLTTQEFQSLQYQRARANQFVALAYQAARQKPGSQFMQPPSQFRYDSDPQRDIMIGELLRREAADLGIVVTDVMVNDFIRAITQEKIGAPDMRDIRSAMGLSESELYNILRREILARLGYQYLYDWSTLSSGMSATLPPASYWDFYQQLNVRESVGIAPIPVSAFINKSTEPTEAELEELFNKYREDFPNRSADGQLVEGRPGFRQPRRVRLAYVEAAFEEVEKLVEQPTDEEIEAFYEENFKTLPAEELGGGESPTGEDAPAADEAGPALPAPPEQDAKTSSPEADDVKDPQSDEPEAKEPPPEGQETEAAPPQGKIDGDDLPPAEGDDQPAPGESDEGAMLPAPRSAQYVALLDDEQPKDQPAKPVSEDAPPADGTGAADVPPAADRPAADDAAESADKPATATDAQPTDKPAPEDAAATESPAPNTDATGTDPPDADAPGAGTPEAPSESNGTTDGPPPPPVAEDAAGAAPAVPALDDELRGSIRDQLLRERTGDKMQEIVENALTFMRELELRLTNLREDPEYLTHEQALEKLQQYAEENGLNYAETPLLSALELQNSEEYPIGRAVDQLFSDPMNPRPTRTVLEQVFQSAPREIFQSQSVIQPETDSRFVYWKVEDQPERVPESLSDPGIREQVVEVWRELKAREKAEARAKELAAMAEKADAPLSESLAEQTVTGEADSQTLTVLHPPPFSWMSKADPRMSPNPWSTPPPEMTQLRSVPGHIGESFMKTVFDDIKAGGAGVAHSIDKDYYYVVRVDERTYGRAPDLAAFRERFMSEPVFAPYYASDYPKLAQSKLVGFQSNWRDTLLKKHDVEFVPQPDRPAEGKEPATAEEPLASSSLY